MKHFLKPTLLAVGALGALALAPASQAQTADALIDKLIEKGVLTSKEGQALREETDKDFTRAYAAKTGMPEWVTSLRFTGDLRLRYDGIFIDPTPSPAAGAVNNTVDRNRLRYRLRFGFIATMQDNIEVGLRLSSAENKGVAGTTIGGDPISGNDSFDNNGSKKLLWIDQAYAKWQALNSPDWSATFIGGKMENPFAFSDMVFDPDYTPEGLAAQFGYNLSEQHALKFNTGLFVLNEEAGTSRDALAFGAQLRLDSTWNQHWSSSFGLSGLSISDKQSLGTATVLNVNQGNTRTGTLPDNSFSPVIVDGSLTYTLESFPFYSGAFPIRVGGEYANNPSAARRGQAYVATLALGKSGKRGTWDFVYRYKNLEANYWFEELVDSDHGAFYQVASANTTGTGYGAGTNIRGHYMRGSYSFTDAFTLGATYYLFDLIDRPVGALSSQVGRVQIDAIFKF